MTANYCGTGLDEYVPPGDPNLGSSVLSARAVWPGVELTWTYPNVNPEGVAHTKVYRSQSNNFSSAVQLTIAEGGYYFDQEPSNVDIIFYYWIRMISVNGTVGPVIGPASAVKNAMVDQIINELGGQLNNSHLNAELNASIDQITDNTSGLSDLKQEQLFGDAVLSAMWDDLRVALDANENAIFEVRTESISQDEVLLQTINGMTAGLDGNLAEYGELIQVLVDNDEAQAAQISTLTTNVGKNTAAISDESIARVKEDEAIVLRVSTLEANTDPDGDGDYASLQEQMIAVSKKADDAQEAADDADDAAAAALEAANTAAGAAKDSQDDATKALKDSKDAFDKATGADGKAVAAQGDVDDLEDETYAMYTLKSDVNGLVSGFGSYNNGYESSFLVHADTFGIGYPLRGDDPNQDTVFPFIVGKVDGNAVIALNAQTMITDAAITSAKIVDAAITSVKIRDANITSAKIQDASVETLKIGDAAVTVPEGESAYVSVQVGNAWTYLDTEFNDMLRWPGDGGPNGPGNYPKGMIISAQVSFSGNNGPGGGGYDGWQDWDPTDPYDPNNPPIYFPFMSPEEEEDPDAVPFTGAPAGPGTIGVSIAIEWFTNQGAWSPDNTTSNSTRSWSSVNEGYGGCVVSNTFISVPYWSRGIRCRIMALNKPAGGLPVSKQTREATRYGYFILGSKR
jgi:hypothetical protein